MACPVLFTSSAPGNSDASLSLDGTEYYKIAGNFLQAWSFPSFASLYLVDLAADVYTPLGLNTTYLAGENFGSTVMADDGHIYGLLDYVDDPTGAAIEELVLLRYLPDGTDSSIVGVYPSPTNGFQQARITWHPTDADHLYVLNQDGAGIPVDPLQLWKLHRTTGARTVLLADVGYDSGGFYAQINQYESGLLFQTDPVTPSDGDSTFWVWDIPTATFDTLDIVGQVAYGFGVAPSGFGLWIDQATNLYGGGFQIAVAGGAVSIAAAPASCNHVGLFDGWFATPDRSLIFNADNRDLFVWSPAGLRVGSIGFH